MTTEPWTFEDLELHPQDSWEVYDPNLARTVAVFYDLEEARAYLAWRNKRQGKLRAKHEKAASRLAEWRSRQWS